MRICLRLRSPSYWPWSWGTATWDSSMTTRKSSGKKSMQRVGRLARAAAVDGRRVVLDAVAVPDLLHHLEVVLGAHPQALGLEQLALLLELGQPLLELGLDADDGLGHPLLAGHVVGGRVDGQVLVLAHLLAGERVDHRDGLDLVAEELDPDRGLVVGGVDLDDVAPDPELAPDQVGVVAVVLHVDQLAAGPPAGRTPPPPSAAAGSCGSRRASRGRRCTTPRPRR